MRQSIPRLNKAVRRIFSRSLSWFGNEITRGKRGFRALWTEWLFLWQWLGVTFSAMLIAYLFARDVDLQFAAYTGGLLQLAGVIAVALGLNGTRKLFDPQPLWTAVIKTRWQNTVAAWKRQGRAAIGGSASLVSDGGRIAITVTTRPAPDATLEQKVNFLLEQHESTQRRVHGLGAEIKATEERLDNALQEEQKERARQISKQQQRLEEVAVGGLSLEGLGLTWLLVGLVLSTIGA